MQEARGRLDKKLEIVAELTLEEALTRNNLIKQRAALATASGDGAWQDPRLALNATEKYVFDQFYEPGMQVIRKGWPDLVFVKDGRPTFVEVKSEKDTLSPAQIETLSVLKGLGFDVRVIVVSKEAT